VRINPPVVTRWCWSTRRGPKRSLRVPSAVDEERAR
jgi:hypothetical protein